MSATSNTCHGFIMAHQAPGASPIAPVDPYAVIHCPYPVCLPRRLSEACKDSKRHLVCGKLQYCERHHCGYCKKASRELAASAEHGQKRAEQVEEEQK